MYDPKVLFAVICCIFYLTFIEAQAPVSSSFLQGRVNYPLKTCDANGCTVGATATQDYFVVGTFQGKQIFGEKQSCDITGDFCSITQRTSLLARGVSDVFLARYKPDNSLVWAARGGGDGEDLGRAIGIDNDGSIYVIGKFAGTARFGNNYITSVTNKRLDCATGCDSFLAKYNPQDGNCVWARRVGDPLKGDERANYWDAQAKAFDVANPINLFNLDYWSDRRTEATIIKQAW